jgi:hypothetical protein
MTSRQYAITTGVVLIATGLIGYGLGRYATPAKVVVDTKVKIEEVVKWRDVVVEKRVEGPVRTVTRTVERPVACVPGETTPSIETVTTIDQGPVVIDHVATSDGAASTNTLAQTTTTITAEQPRWLLQAGAGTGTDLRVVYNAGVSRRLAGPFWLGVSGSTDRRLTLTAGLTF